MTTCGVTNLWQNDLADIKVAIEALAAVGGGNVNPLTVTSARPTGAGTIPEGALSIGIANVGVGIATVNGQTLVAGAGIVYEFISGHYYPAIAYDATGTTLMIEIIRAA